jgi:hypothetical protein
MNPVLLAEAGGIFPPLGEAGHIRLGFSKNLQKFLFVVIRL